MVATALSARAQSYIIGNDTLMAVAALVVITRFYLRIKHSQRKLWWDDFFLGLSLVLAIGFAGVVNVSMVHSGWDRHIWEITAEMLPTSYKTYLLVKILFFLATTSIRTSLLCFYLWLVKDLGSRLLLWTIYACIVANAILCVVCCIITIFTCRHPSDFWTVPRPASSKCVNDGVVTAIMGGFYCFADFIVNTLPLPIVAKLKMPLRQRLSIGMLLSLGAVATIAGVVREYWIYKALIATTDSTYQALPLWVCADVEIYVALLCACGPALKPLVSRLVPRGNTTGFVRRRQSSDQSDQIYLESGPTFGIDSRDSRLQRKIFDGGLTSNVTHICAASQDHLPLRKKSIYDRTKITVASTDSGVGHSLYGIHVVTRIQLDTDETQQPGLS